jgi:glycosyltransferase involved in cell wall biosynthesis
LFYAEYNITLFLQLLFRTADLIVSNDTDTLPAAYLAARLKNSQHLHDCHEYFTGVPELVGRSRTTAIWKWFENMIFPRLQYVTAVNGSIAGLYKQEYGIKVRILRNVPFRKKEGNPRLRGRFGIPEDTRIILYQGAVNIDRGLEEAVLAMKYMQTRAVLVILGTGDIFDKITTLIQSENLEHKVILAGQIPFSELHDMTIGADIGLSIEKNKGINYYYCLPNKLMDYIQSRVPVIVSPFPEMKRIIETYNIGEFIESHDPEKFAGQLDRILNDTPTLELYRKNIAKAAEELCWENEEPVLREILEELNRGQ